MTNEQLVEIFASPEYLSLSLNERQRRVAELKRESFPFRVTPPLLGDLFPEPPPPEPGPGECRIVMKDGNVEITGEITPDIERNLRALFGWAP